MVRILSSSTASELVFKHNIYAATMSSSEMQLSTPTKLEYFCVYVTG